MKKTTMWIIIIGLLIAVSVPIFDDPFHRDGLVTFATWAYREIYELLYGEQG